MITLSYHVLSLSFLLLMIGQYSPEQVRDGTLTSGDPFRWLRAWRDGMGAAG
jgi:hypothetical protein